SNWLVDTSNPALYALIKGLITRDGTTRRNLIPTNVNKPTRTPAANALIQSATGTNVNNTTSAIKIIAIKITGKTSANYMLNPPNYYYLPSLLFLPLRHG